ncbi:MAG: gfo/Idh/MocA family oxidoreductase [Thermoguttaceae bacterium]|jgi:predicted dehydrogenase
MQESQSSRRAFLQQSGGVLAGAALAGSISARAYAGEDNTIKIALVGCGGRGTGAAAEALSTKGPTKLFAMADFFDNRLQACLRGLSGQHAATIDVPQERQFLGLEGYKKAIDAIAPGGVVLLATPPAFRPIHLEYAVAKGCHVFMEKSFAVDAPGYRRVLKAGAEATKKNLKIAGGLRCRHDRPLEEAVAQLHGGLLGEIITLYPYREHGPVGYTPKDPHETELAHQIRNYSNYTWLNGSFLLDWLIHNIDICCWIKQGFPLSAQGHGGRQQRLEPDQLFDHYAVEYTFADGTRMVAQGRHMQSTWNFFGTVVHGAKGSAILGEGQAEPRIYKGFQQRPQDLIWKYKGPAYGGAYQVEHDLLFAAIRNDKPYNETEFSARSAMAGILGRMAAESGQQITWEQAVASNLELAPGLDQYVMDSHPPVMPDAQGKYPVAMPGMTKVL